MKTLAFNYECHKKGGLSRHVWSVVGPKGGWHIWSQETPLTSPIWGATYGGVEVHHMKRPYGHSPEKAPIKDCWLTGCDCWPDGSSLQYEEFYKEIIEITSDKTSLNEFMFEDLRTRYTREWGEP